MGPTHSLDVRRGENWIDRGEVAAPLGTILIIAKVDKPARRISILFISLRDVLHSGYPP